MFALLYDYIILLFVHNARIFLKGENGNSLWIRIIITYITA